MIKIKMVRIGRGTWMWSVDSDKFEDAMANILEKLISNKTTLADNSIPIEIQFSMNQKIIGA